MVEKIVISDNQKLREEKINEWEQGINPDGSIIGKYKSESYAKFKRAKNPRANGNVDLILTGATSASLFVNNAGKSGSFIFGMKDTHNLLSRYPRSILGLNKQWFFNRQKETYLNQLIKEIKTKYKIA